MVSSLLCLRAQQLGEVGFREVGRREEERAILFQLEIRKEGWLSCRGKKTGAAAGRRREGEKEKQNVPPQGWRLHQA